MKKLHMNKILAIAEVKSKAFMGKNCIIMPVFALGFTLLMRFLYSRMPAEGDVASVRFAYGLALGLVMNIGMTGIYCTALLLAEEKEKKTLRVLMTSSVNGLEFFIGSILPPFLVTAALNYVLIPLSGCAIGGAGLAVFTVVTLLSSLASCIIGMLLGIFTKDQVSAGTLISPVLLVLMFVPMFSSLFEPLEYISRFLFTGIIMDTAMKLVIEPDISVDMLGLVVLALETVAAAALFVVFYRRNGYEKD